MTDLDQVLGGHQAAGPVGGADRRDARVGLACSAAAASDTSWSAQTRCIARTASWNIDGIPAAADPQLLSGVLRDTWDFTGTVVADYFAISFLELLHGVAAEAAALALAAGVDVELPTARCSPLTAHRSPARSSAERSTSVKYPDLDIGVEIPTFLAVRQVAENQLRPEPVRCGRQDVLGRNMHDPRLIVSQPRP